VRPVLRLRIEQGLGIPAESPRPRYSTFIAELRKKRDHRWRTLK